MRLLFTGATGFVGRNLLLRLLREKQYNSIVVVVRNREKLTKQLREEGISTLPAELEIITGEAPEWNLTKQTVDHVIHCAGLIAGRNEAEYLAVNSTGTDSLLQSLDSPKKIVILSSLAASGPCDATTLAKEEHHVETPVTWYGQSKLAMEKMLAEKYSHLNYLVLRPPMILGPRDSATLPLFKMGKQFMQFKPGQQPKHYSYISVDDLVDGILTALQSDTDWRTLSKREFFISHTDTITDIQLISGATRACGRKERILRIPQPALRAISHIVDAIPAWRKAIPNLTVDRAREIWPERWVASPKRFGESFGWHGKDNLMDTLQKTAKWYQQSGQL